MTNQKSKNYSSINLEGRNVKITQSPFESETEELSRRMLCSRDHPRTRRRLPFLDSNNRHSLESRAAVSLDISVHAHDGSVLPIVNIMRGRRKGFVRTQQHERLIASKCTNITVLRARLMRQRVHTFITQSHHVERPREIVLSQCVPALITNEIRSRFIRAGRSPFRRSVAIVLREALQVCTLWDDNYTNRRNPR